MQLLDSTSLLIAVAIATVALMSTLLLNWTSTRSDRFLLSWCGGLALIVASVCAFTQLSDPWLPSLQLLAFAALAAGFSLIYLGGRQFLNVNAHPVGILAFWSILMTATSLLFSVGLTGVGVIVVNIACTILLLLTARDYWRGRNEAPTLMVGISGVYTFAGLSFLLCAFELTRRGDFILHAHPDNWAEDINLIACMIALGSIGGMTMTVNQMRVSRSHRVDAMTDALTGLPNRRALFDLADRMDLIPGTAVIMFDLDHFKVINDRFGHARGDEVLKRFAAVLNRSLRHGDIAARLGGEEFCVILNASEPVRALDVAEHIRVQFLSAPVLSDDFGHATVSAGFAVSRDGETSLDTLMREADSALYDAKSEGRNNVRPGGGSTADDATRAPDTPSNATPYVFSLSHRRTHRRIVEIEQELDAKPASAPQKPFPRIAG